MNLCRPALALAVAILSFPAQADLALAESPYPNQAIKLVVPYAAGGFPDTTARIVAAHMQDKIGQSAVVENRPGGAGSVAVNALTSSPADGYTLMVTSNGHTVSGLVSKDAPFDPVKDFAGITRLGSSPLFLIAFPGTPVNNLKDVIELAKKEPGKLNFSSPGLASTTFIAGALFRKAANIDIVHVPYKSAPPALQDLIAGRAAGASASWPARSTRTSWPPSAAAAR